MLPSNLPEEKPAGDHRKGKARETVETKDEQKSLTSAVSEIAERASTSISNSAASLYNSIAYNLHPEEINRGLSQTNPSKAQTFVPGSSRISYPDVSPSLRTYDEAGASDSRGGFRTFKDASSIDNEFQTFSENSTSAVHSSNILASNAASNYFFRGAQQPTPQEDILAVLSSPEATSAIWAPDPITISEQSNLPALTYQQPTGHHHSYVADFLASEDIVEYLSRGDTAYTEEVWGDLLPLMREAREEVAASQGKGKEESRESTAIQRLRMVRDQMKSKL